VLGRADHHSLRLTYAPRVGFDLMSFKVTSDDLAELEQAVNRYGFPVERISRGASVGQGESIRFETPSGHAMEVVREVQKVGGSLPNLNPGPSSSTPRSAPATSLQASRSSQARSKLS
jgi:catechol 2,3-dioxygenase